MAGNGNLAKQLASGVSVFGWYTRFDEKGEATVHVDLNFSVGKFGSGQTDTVEFELEFKRVEIVVFCGDGVRPIKSSIARILNSDSAERTIVEEIRAEGSVGVDVSISSRSTPSAGVDASGKLSKSVTETVSRSESAATMLISHSLVDNRHPSWQVRETSGVALVGAPWDPEREPRFRFKFLPTRVDPDPSLRIVLRCRREDMILRDIRVKDEKKRKLSFRTPAPEANMLAAQQFLKEEILKEGLPLPRVEHRYGEVTLADVVITLDD